MSSIKLTKLPGISRIELPQIKPTPNKFKGSHILPIQWFVMSILAKRRSGKTTLIYNLIKKFTNKQTIVIMFASTVNKDPVYKAILEYLDEKGINHLSHTHYMDGSNNLLDTYIDMLGEGEKKEEKEEEEEKETEREPQITAPSLLFDNLEDEEAKKRTRAARRVTPNYLFIFDDLNKDIRHKSILKLCKNSRHYKARVILSSQSVTDIHPEAFAQLDYVGIFKSFNDVSLRQIYDRLEPWVSFEKFMEIYHTITSENYAFLFMDRNLEQFRSSLNKLVEVHADT